MNREQKKEAVKELKDRFQKAAITLLADFTGLKVNEMNELRRELRENSAEMKVIKNTLARLAVDKTELEPLKEKFQGPLAAITSETDPVGPAKILIKFAKDTEKPKLKGGFMSGSLIEEKDIEALSKLPSREELLAKLLGSMQSPAQKLVNVFAAVPRELVTVLAAVRDKKTE